MVLEVKDQVRTYEQFKSIPIFGSNSSTDNNPFAGIARLQLEDPAISAGELVQVSGSDLDTVKLVYKLMQTDSDVRELTSSVFYSRRMMYKFTADTAGDFARDPEYAQRLVSGEPISSRVVELHPTKGTCDYGCTMCLWSDKDELTYERRKLNGGGLMMPSDWEKVLKDSYVLGAKTAVFSGGGETLLNSDLTGIIRIAKEIGYRTHLYTNGYSLDRLKDEEWDELLKMEQIRFSMHSPDPKTYNEIVSMPDRAGAIKRVSRNIQELKGRKEEKGSGPRIGIGFVTQPLNFSQIMDMADFAVGLSVDFLNIRRDEVDVTRQLIPDEVKIVAGQLNGVRDKLIKGEYGETDVDMSDDLTALANGETLSVRKASVCMSKYFRLAISPFGIFAPCDLKAEPRFSDQDYILGNVKFGNVMEILQMLPSREVKADCTQCMPSGRTGNAIFNKLLSDIKDGVRFNEQPYFLR